MTSISVQSEICLDSLITAEHCEETGEICVSSIKIPGLSDAICAEILKLLPRSQRNALITELLAEHAKHQAALREERELSDV